MDDEQMTRLPTTEEVAEVLLNRPPRWLGFSLILAAAGIVGGLVTAWVASIEVIVTVTGGVVRPASDVVSIQPMLDARVLDVRVHEGDVVKAGDLLFRLDSRDVRTELDKNLSHQEELKNQLAARQRAVESLEREDRAAQEREKRELEGAHLGLAKAQADRERVVAELRESEARVLEARASHDPSQELVKSGLVTETEARLARARLEIAIAEQDKVKMDVNAADVELSLAQNHVPAVEAAASESGERRSRELHQVQAEIAEFADQLDQLVLEEQHLTAQLDDFELRAPVAGTVTSLSFRTPGRFVLAGDTLATLAPGGVPWVVEAYVPDRDVGALPRSVGNTVRLKFDAFPFRDYGVLVGRLRNVDPDSTWNEQLGRVYRVTIAIDSVMLQQGPRSGQVRLGMQATAEIVKERERILYLLFRRARDSVLEG